MPLREGESDEKRSRPRKTIREIPTNTAAWRTSSGQGFLLLRPCGFEGFGRLEIQRYPVILASFIRRTTSKFSCDIARQSLTLNRLAVCWGLSVVGTTLSPQPIALAREVLRAGV